jgi:DNA-binding transcriptional ArsR family regulator
MIPSVDAHAAIRAGVRLGGAASAPSRQLSHDLTYGFEPGTLKYVLNYSQAEVDRVFAALADPTRRAMAERLSRGPASASELAEPLNITLSAVVQHLAVLQGSGLVRSEKRGRVRVCEMEPSGLGLVEQWIAERKVAWEAHLDRLGEYLATEEE